MGVGMPEQIKLLHFGEEVADAFGATAYHVGSSLRLKTGWRDVDVRVILDDDEFERQIGALTRPRCMNARWNALCLAFSARGRELTGLPIDFQIDQQTQANRDYDEPRSALIALWDVARCTCPGIYGKDGCPHLSRCPNSETSRR